MKRLTHEMFDESTTAVNDELGQKNSECIQK